MQFHDDLIHELHVAQKTDVVLHKYKKFIALMCIKA